MIRPAPLRRAGTQTPPSPAQVPAGEGGCASASCLWCWRIQTAMPAVSERRLLGAERDEAWTELRTPSPGLALLLQAREGIWTRRWGYRAGRGRAPVCEGSSLERAPPHLWSPRTAGKKGPPFPQRQALQRAEIKEIKNNQPSLTGLRGGFYSVIYVKALRNFVMGPCKCKVINLCLNHCLWVVCGYSLQLFLRSS